MMYGRMPTCTGISRVYTGRHVIGSRGGHSRGQGAGWQGARELAQENRKQEVHYQEGGSWRPKAGSRRPKAGSRQQDAGVMQKRAESLVYQNRAGAQSKEQRAWDRRSRAWSREQGTHDTSDDKGHKDNTAANKAYGDRGAGQGTEKKGTQPIYTAVVYMRIHYREQGSLIQLAFSLM